jgi:hypothetical protein
MATKKAVKKMDLASDDGVLDLKSKDRSAASFKVHKIEYDQDDYERENTEMAVTHVPSTREINPIKARPKFDPDELHQRMESFAEKLEKAVVKVAPNESAEAAAANPKELIKVKFGKFVQLVASRDFLEILDKNKDEELIMSSNLLTDLAGAVEEKSEKKTPVIFVIGLAIGVIITYFLISK